MARDIHECGDRNFDGKLAVLLALRRLVASTPACTIERGLICNDGTHGLRSQSRHQSLLAVCGQILEADDATRSGDPQCNWTMNTRHLFGLLLGGFPLSKAKALSTSP